MSARVASHVGCRLALILQLAGAGEPYDRPARHVTVVARDRAMTSIAWENATPARVTEYMRVVWSDTVTTITSSEAAHLSRLIELAGNAS